MAGHHFAVVGSEDHDRVVRQSGFVEIFQQPAEIVVHIAEHGVVAARIHQGRVTASFDIGAPVERLWRAVEASRGRLVGTPRRMRRMWRHHQEKRLARAGSGAQKVQREIRFRVGFIARHHQPLRGVAIVKRLAEVGVKIERRPILISHAPGTGRHEFRFGLSGDRLAALERAGSGSGSQMPLADVAGIVTAAREDLADRLSRGGQVDPVHDAAGQRRPPPGLQHGPVRRAQRAGRQRVSEIHALAGEAIDVGSRGILSTVVTGFAQPDLVGEKEQHIRLRRMLRRGQRRAGRSQQRAS